MAMRNRYGSVAIGRIAISNRHGSQVLGADMQSKPVISYVKISFPSHARDQYELRLGGICSFTNFRRRPSGHSSGPHHCNRASN